MRSIERVPVWRNAREIYRGVYRVDTEIGRLGPRVSDLLLSEILPLPRPRHNAWPAAYHSLGRDPKEYQKKALPAMVDRLVHMVGECRPEVVLLHGKAQHNRWIKGHSFNDLDWASEPVTDIPRQAVLWTQRHGTLWIRSNNLVNNGFVRTGPAQIAQLVSLIDKHRVPREQAALNQRRRGGCPCLQTNTLTL